MTLYAEQDMHEKLLPNQSLQDEEERMFRKTHSYCWFSAKCYFICIFVLIALSLAELLSRSGRALSNRQDSAIACLTPSDRREWRSLNGKEQAEYIRAVQCLRASTSLLGLDTSLYFDFPMVHSQMGETSHLSAPFLPWHRYFLHLYEKTLRERCGYAGQLPYWDWTIDYLDFANSPIWDGQKGFGGDGNTSDQQSISDGYCVTDGPFARLIVPYEFLDTKPHCLSRGFESKPVIQNLSREISPEAIDQVLSYQDFEAFNLGLENGPHAAVPAIVRGEFAHFTAPSDPVFFLHHSQLDRIWWMWQRQDLPRRIFEYAGQAAYQSDDNASLEDRLQVGGLGQDTIVRDIMHTESGILCYKYS